MGKTKQKKRSRKARESAERLIELIERLRALRTNEGPDEVIETSGDEDTGKKIRRKLRDHADKVFVLALKEAGRCSQRVWQHTVKDNMFIVQYLDGQPVCGLMVTLTSAHGEEGGITSMQCEAFKGTALQVMIDDMIDDGFESMSDVQD